MLTKRDLNYIILIVILIFLAVIFFALGIKAANAGCATPGYATITINTQPYCFLGNCATAHWLTYQGHEFIAKVYGRNLYLGKTVYIEFCVPKGFTTRAWVRR